LPIFDTRIETFLPEEREQLLRVQKVVRAMYAAFSEGLTDYELPTIYSLATMEDGRTRESKYSSLMSLEARVTYGI
jgi:hypothetical protein